MKELSLYSVNLKAFVFSTESYADISNLISSEYNWDHGGD